MNSGQFGSLKVNTQHSPDCREIDHSPQTCLGDCVSSQRHKIEAPYSCTPPTILCIITTTWELYHNRPLQHSVHIRRIFWGKAFKAFVFTGETKRRLGGLLWNVTLAHSVPPPFLCVGYSILSRVYSAVPAWHTIPGYFNKYHNMVVAVMSA